MFDYKDASFYTSYFNEHPLFKLTEEFRESEDKEEKNLYVGYVEVLNTIHPLVLRVEIPKSFPHQHLVFRTKSLSGYPHLIHRDIRTGEINKNGDWFCLNTPFAETAKEQLDIEVLRLKEWINRQMRDDLPAEIKGKDVIDALRRANIYGWENYDEVNEIQVDADLTFVGDFSNDLDYFKERTGHLHCIKTRDKRYYAFAEKQFTNCELPYLIVDEVPKDIETLNNFVALKRQYGWNEDLCKHLFPHFNLSETWSRASGFVSYSGKEYSLEEIIDELNCLRKELYKEISYIEASTEEFKQNQYTSIIKKKVLTKVHPKHKDYIKTVLDEIEQNARKENGYHPFFRLRIIEEDSEETDFDPEDEMRSYQNELHSFALGVLTENHIIWYLLSTNIRNGVYDNVTYQLVYRELKLSKLVSYPLLVQKAQLVGKKTFFGRGVLSNKFHEKRIALIGLGAIGSVVAESLARSGVTVIGLWDNDIVEPGNICRSTYLLSDIGESKVDAIAKKIRYINPFLETKEIKAHGYWLPHNVNYYTYEGGSFYNNINYDNQEQSLSQIKGYDIIIDCTGSNEMLHFLSYAVPDATIISLCITNHSNDLLCITNKNGNPFELRRAYLSRIEQDTKNFYLEGSGCYSPTFLARNCDISSLVNLAIREINDVIDKGETPGSMVLSHNRRGVLIDRLESYKAEGYDIWMTIPTETLLDAEEMADAANGEIGYILGTYSRDGKMIMVTHIVGAQNARNTLEDAFKTSKGIVDYIGDYRYSGEQPNTYTDNALETLAAKAEDESINTNNPLLAVRNPDGTVSFFLFINNGLVSLVKQS